MVEFIDQDVNQALGYSAATLHILAATTTIRAYRLSKPMFTFPSHTFCQCSYANYAWAHTYRGSYITTDGSIYHFDGIANEQTLIGTVLPEDLARMTALAALVAGQTFEGVHAGCDMGTFSISLYPDSPDASRTVILSESGNFEGQLDSAEAKELCLLIEKYCPQQ